jgi:stage III sporulation protein SpoIIIAA
MKILLEKLTRILPKDLKRNLQKAGDALNTSEIKEEMQSRIEEIRHHLMDGITLQFQKEMEENIQEGQHKILE